jgi:hypothetical protein
MTTMLPPSHLARMAKVLEEMSTEVEALGLALCSDPKLAHSLMRELQAVDLIAQKQRSLARLLVAECAESAIGQLGMEDLRRRLTDPGE